MDKQSTFFTRRTWILAALCMAVGWTAPSVYGQGGGKSLQAVLVLASNKDAPADRDLGSLDGLLRRVLKFKHYEHLGSARTTAKVPGKTTLKVGHGNVLAVDLSDAGGGKVRAAVRWTKGGKGVVNTTVVLSPGTPAILGGASHAGGKLVVALTAR